MAATCRGIVLLPRLLANRIDSEAPRTVAHQLLRRSGCQQDSGERERSRVVGFTGFGAMVQTVLEESVFKTSVHVSRFTGGVAI